VSYACAGTTEVTCSFAPVAVNPTPSSPGFTTVPITASYSALMLSPKEPIGRGFWLLASALPFGIFLGAAAKKQMSLRGSIMTLLTYGSSGFSIMRRRQQWRWGRRRRWLEHLFHHRDRGGLRHEYDANTRYPQRNRYALKRFGLQK
jgi:hypothetical protein